MSNNIDYNEIKKFDEMAAQWWDLEGPCKPLHQLNPVRLHFIQNCIPLKGKRILDVGCGGGILTESLSKLSPYVMGIDGSDKAITVAKAHAQNLIQKPDYQCITAEEYALHNAGCYEVITCMELIEHVPSPISLLQALSTLLKPNGHLFLSTLNRTPKAFLFAIIGAEYLMRMLPRGTHDYDKFIRPSELVSWANTQQLAIQNLRGVTYKPFMGGFELSDDLGVNYLAHFTKEAL